ncbi:MAG: hypothetical protein JWN86_1330 [Planctomycetota bacterium]|nr:hypothetical protein [Planctomycetota bacterium]
MQDAPRAPPALLSWRSYTCVAPACDFHRPEIIGVRTVSETRVERLIDLGFECAMMILIGIPICSILCALVLALCLLCLPFVVLVSPLLYVTSRRRRRAKSHPLSDRSLGVFPVSMVSAAWHPGGAGPVSTGFGRRA